MEKKKHPTLSSNCDCQTWQVLQKNNHPSSIPKRQFIDWYESDLLIQPQSTWIRLICHDASNKRSLQTCCVLFPISDSCFHQQLSESLSSILRTCIHAKNTVVQRSRLVRSLNFCYPRTATGRESKDDISELVEVRDTRRPCEATHSSGP